MSAALTSDLATAYLRELSADITAVVVLGADGRLLAGSPELLAPASALLAHAPPGPGELHGRTRAGAAFAARDERHQLVAVTGPLALPRLTRHDLRATLAALSGAGRALPEMPPIEAPERLVEPLVTAARGRL